MNDANIKDVVKKNTGKRLCACIAVEVHAAGVRGTRFGL